HIRVGRGLRLRRHFNRLPKIALDAVVVLQRTSCLFSGLWLRCTGRFYCRGRSFLGGGRGLRGRGDSGRSRSRCGSRIWKGRSVLFRLFRLRLHLQLNIRKM
ncbi:hypothetical protein PFISCL1PPCAC_9032, partial [Pristionchus fissidentatus]